MKRSGWVDGLGPAGVVLLAGLLLAACGSPTPSPAVSPSGAAADTIEACALAPDLPAIVGREPLASPSSYRLGVNERCLWVYGNDPSRYVGLTLGGTETHAATVRSFGEGEAVDGLGDEARWWPATRTISVILGEHGFQVDFRLDDGEGSRELAIDIARHALERLP